MAELEEFAARVHMVARQSRIDRAAIAAVQALAAGGIEALVLKGPALARTLYRSDEHRGYFDVDLLVPARDRAAAGEVLARLGYIDFARTSGLHIFPEDPHADLWSGVVAVDLHWRLPGCQADPARVWEVLHARRTWVELGGTRMPILDTAGLALHLALHAAQHGPEDRKAIGDLARGLERWPLEVWREAAAVASAVGASETFSAGLRLLAAGAALAGELGLPPAGAVLQAIGERKFRPRGTSQLQALIDARGVRARASVLRWSLFPEQSWMSRRYPWAPRSGLHLAGAYALQLARAPGWAMRAWRFRRLAGERRTVSRPGD
jgi:hypothetical protein